jgi:hypothetical protein
MPSSCWLIDVEAGFELWQGGAGLATSSFSVNVNGSGGGSTVTVASPGNQAGTAGTAAAVQVHASDSAPGQTLAYSAAGLPAGLSINSATGLISGTPAAAGTSNVTVTARDGTGASGSAAFTWTVNPSGRTSGGGGSTLHGHVSNHQHLAVRVPRTGHGDRGIFDAQRRERELDLPRRPEDHQHAEEFRHQSGDIRKADDASYNGTHAAEASVTFGFTGN